MALTGKRPFNQQRHMFWNDNRSSFERRMKTVRAAIDHVGRITEKINGKQDDVQRAREVSVTGNAKVCDANVSNRTRPVYHA